MARPQHVSHARGRRWIWIAIPALAVLALVGAFAWDGVELLRSKDGLTLHAQAAQRALSERDAESLVAESAALEASARRFAAATDGPHWWLAAHTPWVADQVVPLRAAGAAVDSIAEGALSPLAAMGDLSAVAAPQFEDGRIDPYLLEPYRATLASASAVLDAQTAALGAIDVEDTVAQVREPFLDLESQIGEVADLVGGAHAAAELLPSMLGGEGARTYLVMVQNNAEPRTTGGIPGAVLEIAVDGGRISLDRYATANSMIDPEGPVTLTDDELRIFARRMEVYPQNVNFTPQYPRSAELMSEFWQAEYGEVPDGVLSIDPVALGYMLEGAPATEVGPFSVTGDNLAQVMLRDSYLEFPEPADQDRFFALASATLFGRIVGGDADAVGGIERAIDEARFMAWSADPIEQAVLEDTPVGGAFLDDEGALGVFINDGSGAKIGYYIDVQTAVESRTCGDGSLKGQTVTVTLTHTFDGNVEDLPEYVATGAANMPRGEFHANVRIFPASHTGVTAVTIDGEVAGLNPETLNGRSVVTVRTVLRPGESATLAYDIASNASGLAVPRLAITPGPKPNVYSRTSEVVVDAC